MQRLNGKEPPENESVPRDRRGRPTLRQNRAFVVGAVITRARNLQSTLARVLGGSTDVILRLDAWCRIDADADPRDPVRTPLSGELARLIDEEFRGNAPHVIDRGERGQLAILPVANSAGIDCGVLCQIPCQREDLFRKLTSALIAACDERRDRNELQAQLDDFARQVTADFEELAWLRNLAGQIELCGVENDVVHLAGNVLPALRGLIGAESIAILPLQTDATQDKRSLAPVYSTGSWNIAESTCLSLLHQFGAATLDGPVVRNFPPDEAGRAPALRNVIVTHIGRGRGQFGWLFVVNKVYVGPRIAVSASACNSNEFGTNEAGMVTAAAVLLGSHAHNLAMFREQEEIFRGVVKALVDAIDAKDSYTCGHSDRVARMARRLAEELDLSEEECEQIYMTGLLHDIGKIGVPDGVLQKPGKLTDEEFALIKKHPEIGYSILQHLPRLSYAFPGVLHHHESVDGRGYPYGLGGECIPLYGRILAVVDAYDAMTSDRPYRDGMPTEKAETTLRRGAGQQWDARVVDAFFRARADIYRICNTRCDAVESREPVSSAEPASQHERRSIAPITTLPEETIVDLPRPGVCSPLGDTLDE